MKKKKILLVCHADSTTGLGHLSRLLALAQCLKKIDNLEIEFLIFGDNLINEELKFFTVKELSIQHDFEHSIKNYIDEQYPAIVVFDLFPKLIPNNLRELLLWIKEKRIKLVGIDSIKNYISLLDLVWVPTFYLNSINLYDNEKKIISGWNTLLIQKRLPSKEWKVGKRVLVLTGGSDTTNLRNQLPDIIDNTLRNDTTIDWIQGPFSKYPNVPKKPRLVWNIHKSLSQLDELIVKSNYALTVYGISFFEILQYGIPTIVFSPYGDKDFNELESLSEESVAMVAKNPIDAVEKLAEIMNNKVLALKYSKNALTKMSSNGAQYLSQKICSLIDSV